MMDNSDHQQPAVRKHTRPLARVRVGGAWFFGAALFFLPGCAGEGASDSGSAALVSPSAGSGTAASADRKTLGPFTLEVPSGWVEQTPRSRMRKAQYALPRTSGDAEDGELTVFYFGMGRGGSTEANINRWIGQVSQPDGSSSRDKAKIRSGEVSAFKVTELDVGGTLNASNMPGLPQRPARPGYRLLGAVLETSQGPWFFKLVGPEKTISHWADSFRQFIHSARPK